jgi:SAM-dependent methyltransferase
VQALADLRRLWRLARRRQRSPEDYAAFQAQQASMLAGYLRRHGVTLSGKTVLDLGSGLGGYSAIWLREGARVVALDLIRPAALTGERYAGVVGDAQAAPLRDASMAFVFCASLIEHVAAPERLLAEVARVLAPGGYCYLSFPPFYSPRGGHEFAPYHYLGERLALKLTPARRRELGWSDNPYQIIREPESYANLYVGWGLYRMTVAKARRLIAGSGLGLVDMSTRYMPASFIRWPVIGEALTWHAQFLLRKPDERVS